MKLNISSRRQLFTAVLLILAVGGGLVRWLVPPPSLARDLGTLLLVLWLPIVGNIIGWLMGRARAPKVMPPGFSPDAAFVPSAWIELTLFPAAVPAESRPVPAGLFPCLVVLENEGFSARLQIPRDEVPVPEAPQPLQLEFVRPELALPKLLIAREFTLLSGRKPLGRGRLLDGPAV
ncbi:hypothetical protein [Ottowia thiooxydans]|uniref:hypothetical protein n=1 Tax=Ottowia thiooxydans TaxID=219182 RepID=UPI0003F52BEF|nr:hypothetical protein [Ottowia thiooxydans]